MIDLEEAVESGLAELKNQNSKTPTYKTKIRRAPDCYMCRLQKQYGDKTYCPRCGDMIERYDD